MCMMRQCLGKANTQDRLRVYKADNRIVTLDIMLFCKYNAILGEMVQLIIAIMDTYTDAFLRSYNNYKSWLASRGYRWQI